MMKEKYKHKTLIFSYGSGVSVRTVMLVADYIEI